jgi:tRNA dimethylallyltransferase
MQVYAGLRMITGAPTPAEERSAPHLLYGHVDPARGYSVGDWLREVEQVLREEHKRPLIFVGGTGLYFHALTRGMTEVPEIPPAVRAALRTRAAALSAAELHAELAQRDPEMAARLRPSDPQRVLRALEVLEATGRSLLAWQQGPAASLLPPERTVRLVVTVERHALRERIARRFAAMMEEGALDEVAALRARNLASDLPAMKALGIVPLLRHLAGELTREEAVALAVRDTRRYAKRQDTWARNRLSDWPRAAPEEAFAALRSALR